MTTAQIVILYLWSTIYRLNKFDKITIFSLLDMNLARKECPKLENVYKIKE